MRILHKTLLAVLLPALVVTLLGSVLLYVGLQRGFLNYVSELEASRLQPAQERLARLYGDEGSFESLADDPARWRHALRWNGGGIGRQHPPVRARDKPPRRRDADRSSRQDPMELTHRVSLYDAQRRLVIGDGAHGAPELRLEILHDGQHVGELGVRPIERLHRQMDLDYLRGQGWMLLVVALTGVVVAGGVGGLLARRISRPISEVAASARQLAHGDLDARVAALGSDELGELGRDFNAMAKALSDAEQVRRRWVADTSHELRTPLAVLQGELEALIDGIYQPDERRLGSLHDEVRRLGQLVDDLDLLSRADRGDLHYEMRAVDISVLLDELAQRHQLQLRDAGLRLVCQSGDGITVLGDAARLTQLFANLISNSCRYTDAGGKVAITTATGGGVVQVSVEDSAPGVASPVLALLFERFYRPDDARTRAAGGSGLGLSICKRIAEAHGGKIEVEPSDFGGLRVTVSMPQAH